MSLYLNYDGKILKASEPLINADNRGLRYGDGLFETIKMKEGKILSFPDHFDRLLHGMELLSFQIPSWFTIPFFEKEISELCRINNHSQSARIRWMILRGSGTLYNWDGHSLHFIIETNALQESPGINEPGLITGIYEKARKAIDGFSHLKSNNYQPYFLAALHARKMGWAESILLNTNGTVCESTIANIFIIKNGNIITPSLSQGCIAGIMRKNVLSALPGLGYKITEEVLTIEMLQDADEVFLTNSIQGIRWVAQIDDVFYTKNIVTDIYNTFIHSSISNKAG